MSVTKKRVLKVSARPKSYVEQVLEMGENEYRVDVREPPENGLANLAVRRALAEHLGVSASRLTLIRGASSRQKYFMLD